MIPFRRRIGILALAGALVLAGCSAADPSDDPTDLPPPTSSPVPSASADAGGTCAEAIDVTIDVRDAATGWAFLVLANTGEFDCSLQGFPAVIAMDTEGGTIGEPAEQSDGFGRASTAVVVAPGERAYAELIYTPAAKVGLGECDPEVPVRGFSVTVPGAEHEEFVDIPDLTFCLGEPWMTLSSVGPVDSEPRAASA